MNTTIVMSLLAALCTTAHAQDPVKTSPQYYKVLLENDQVRVLEYRLKAGEKEPMHSHPAGVVYVLSGAKLKFSYPDGRTEERAAATGETIWRDPTTHAVENVGDTEAHAIAIDLKNPGQHTSLRREVEGRNRKEKTLRTAAIHGEQACACPPPDGFVPCANRRRG